MPLEGCQRAGMDKGSNLRQCRLRAVTLQRRLFHDKLFCNYKIYFNDGIYMEPLRRIQNFDHLKILADSRRLVILRLLMSEAMTLSQIG